MTRPPKPDEELRLFGLNAVKAAFAARPGDLRKLWLVAGRMGELREVLAHCVAHRKGYTLVEADELARLAGTQHHEGVVMAVRRPDELPLSTFLRDLPSGTAQLLWLDGVGNPHNFGAILRSAAHFGVAGVLLPKASPLALSGAAVRVAEGGAEAVPLVRLGRVDNAIAQLQACGFVLLATTVRDGRDLYAGRLPERCVWVLGAEGQGVDPALAAACAARVGIPGTGRVESRNVASATAVLLAEWTRQRR
ncbi:MAG: TrmH family RNA methyltransferase [Lysobacteraceae bacterium]